MVRLRTVLLSAAAFGLVACGSGDDDAGSSGTEADAPVGEPSVDEQPVDESPVDEQAAGGSGTGTVTLSDETMFEFVMTTCETSENGASGFVIDDGFDLFGRTADGAFTMQLIRAGFDEDNVLVTAGLEGEFDEDGKNADLLYSKVNETMEVSVDGGHVAGSVTIRPIGPNRPYGDETVATFDIDC